MSKTLEEILVELRERDQETQVERKQDEIRRVYNVLPEVIARTSLRSGIDPILLVRLAVECSWHHNMPWYDALALIDTLFTAKERREMEGK